MLHALLKGIFLLSGVTVGIFLTYANGLFALVDQSAVAPIRVSNSSSLNQNKETLKGVLFGDIEVIKAPIVETSLGFVLKGTIPSSHADKSLAIIQLKSKKERVVSVGDELISGVLLVSVFSDYVVISRNGKQEKISFPVVKRNGLLAGGNNTAPLATDDHRSVPQVRQINNMNQLSTSVGVSGQSNQKSQLVPTLKNMAQSVAFDMYEKALEENPEALLGQAGLSVVNSGLKVSANSALVSLGLKQGDTVLSVNGVSASQLVGDTSAIADIRQSGDASVLVQRGSQTLTLNIKF